MKSFRLLKFSAFILLALLMDSCMSTLSIPVLQPAQINLPQYYEKLAVAHRHRASKENTAWNIVEGVLSGEGLFADKEGGVGALNGLKDALLKTPRYIVVEPPGLDLKGTGTGTFPPPLGWNDIEKICQENNADALIILEVFDSNSSVNFTTAQRKVKNKEGVESIVIDHIANMRMNVTTGWRIYDFQQRIIVDEYRFDSYVDFSGRGPNPDAAAASLPIKREAIKRAGFNAGSQYGFRIAPQWINVSRQYYNKGSESLKRASRMARTNDWKGAEEIWLKMSSSMDKKIARRSTYNMAVAREVQGDLEGALEWTRKAYKQYGGGKPLRYSNILQRRISDKARLDDQMK